MANWQFKIDVKNDWEKAQNDEITSIDLAKVIVKELKRIESAVFNKFKETDRIVEELQDLIAEFEGFINYGNDDDNEFNCIFEALYDWGDLEVPPYKA